MTKCVWAGLVYFAIIIGTGFVLGVFRVLLIVPWIGERWAELAEMPIMGATIFFAAGFILWRFPDIHLPSRALMAGLLALALAVGAELALVVIIQSQSLAMYLSSRDKVSGSVYLLMLGIFALMPRLRLRTGK